MKKIKFAIVCAMVIFLGANISAKETCKTVDNVKNCTDVVNGIKITKVYTYKDKTLKLLKKEQREDILIKDNKRVFKSYKTFYDNKKTESILNQYYAQYYRDNKAVYYSSGKIKSYETRQWAANYYETKNTVYNNGIFNKSSYYKKDLKNIVLRNIDVIAHSNGKSAYMKQRDYNNKKLVFDLTAKYTNKGYIYYYYSKNMYKNLIATSKSFDSRGKVKSTSIIYFDSKNKIVQKNLTYYYTNSRKSKTVVNVYKNGKYSNIQTYLYKNNAKANLTSKNILYFNTSGRYYKRVSSYYHATTFKYNGYRNTYYSTSNGKTTSSDLVMYYYNTNLTYYKTNYAYSNGSLTQATTNYYTNTGSRYSCNIKKYSNGKTTYNLTTRYSGSYATLRTGYTYTSKTFSYNHAEYVQGKLHLNDITTYVNNTSNKSRYVREYYRNGVFSYRDTYDYVNGEITKQTKGTKSFGAVKKSYPITKGLITSQAWFYPKSFGGSWHPGIDVASYSIPKYGYAQPIKVFSDATLIKRYNSCRTTNSSGCGEGFGNYTIYALQYEGKFYTILYGHQTQLSSKNANHKTVLTNDGKTVKKDQIIGYVGSSGYSSGYHIHIQVQEHKYAKSISDIQARYKKYNSSLFNVNYSKLGNNSDIYTINPDIFYNLKYAKKW